MLPLPVSLPPTKVGTIYLQLCTVLNTYLMSNNSAELGLSIKPTDALDWQPVPTETVREVDLADDGANDAYEEEV
jgi:hypothetical protein